MPTIGVAVSEEIKKKFEAMASERNMTASRLAGSLLLDFLTPGTGAAQGVERRKLPRPSVTALREGPKTEQVFVRLNPYYFEELGRLANRRNWYRGTYLANLFHAHVDQRPILCEAEINTVRQATRQLADIGRNLNQIARKINAAGEHARDLMTVDLELVRMLVESEVAAMSNLLRANLRGWGISDDQA